MKEEGPTYDCIPGQYGQTSKTAVHSEYTHIIQINVNPTEVSEHKVSDSVCALNGVAVAVEGIEKPWVFGCDELA